VRPAALHARVAKLEAAAREETTPTIGATIAAILSGKPGSRPPVSDEELAQTRLGRLLLQRRQRRWAEASYPG
jgi:hypothetical protein